MHVSVGLISCALMTKQLPEAPERPPQGQLEPNLHLGHNSRPGPAQSCCTTAKLSPAIMKTKAYGWESLRVYALCYTTLLL